ncbi:MAG: hypothetical protein GC181_06725 [Bacteroidetes bacterium]|nr:hypothetical protein [Bacteroidota bacterium]
MKKRILSVLAGVATGVFLISISEMVNHHFYPPPAGFNPNDKEAIAAFMKTLPESAFIGLLIGWLISVFGAGAISALVAKTVWKKTVLITGSILLLAAIANMVMIPHPFWLKVAVLVTYLPVCYLGGWLVAGRNN